MISAQAKHQANRGEVVALTKMNGLAGGALGSDNFDLTDYYGSFGMGPDYMPIGGNVNVGSSGGGWANNVPWGDVVTTGIKTASAYILKPKPGEYQQITRDGSVTYRLPSGAQDSSMFNTFPTLSPSGSGMTWLIIAAVAIGGIAVLKNATSH